MWQFLLTHTPILYFTQSIWRDEAFSVLLAQRPVGFILNKLSLEPPLPYVTLHYWIKIFGTSELSVRGFMLLIFCLATIVVIFWAEKIFEKHWLSLFLPIFFFLNPMLLYYAFEVRSYSWYILFSVLLLYAYTQKKWWLFTMSTIGGLYTHTYMLFLIAATVVHWILLTYSSRKNWRFKTIFKDPLLRSIMVAGVLYLPWFIKITQSLSHMGSTWYFPVDLRLVKSALGNMFVGYEGTPWYGWKYTARLSLALLGFFILACTNKKQRSLTLLALLVVFIPLTVVIGVSFYKPLYVNRYLIPVTIGEVLLISLAISAIRKPILQFFMAGVIISGIIWFNSWYPDKHQKFDIRTTMREIHMLKKPDDYIYAMHPLIYLETVYYSENPQKTYFYNPNNSPFPWYVGDAVVDSRHMASSYPTSPHKAFLVHRDGTYSVAYQTPIKPDTNKK